MVHVESSGRVAQYQLHVRVRLAHHPAPRTTHDHTSAVCRERWRSRGVAALDERVLVEQGCVSLDVGKVLLVGERSLLDHVDGDRQPEVIRRPAVLRNNRSCSGSGRKRHDANGEV